MECQLQGLLDVSEFPSGRGSVGRDKEMAEPPGSRRRLLVESWERHLRGSELNTEGCCEVLQGKVEAFPNTLAAEGSELAGRVGSWAP